MRRFPLARAKKGFWRAPEETSAQGVSKCFDSAEVFSGARQIPSYIKNFLNTRYLEMMGFAIGAFAILVLDRNAEVGFFKFFFFRDTEDTYFNGLNFNFFTVYYFAYLPNILNVFSNCSERFQSFFSRLYSMVLCVLIFMRTNLIEIVLMFEN